MTMIYHLDDISHVLGSIAGAFAAFGTGASQNFIEETRRIEQELTRLYPKGCPAEPLFAASIAINALVVMAAAAESRQREIETRSEKHVEAMRTMKGMEEATKRPSDSDNLLAQYLALADDDSKKN
jgi:hypothetical protein